MGGGDVTGNVDRKFALDYRGPNINFLSPISTLSGLKCTLRGLNLTPRVLIMTPQVPHLTTKRLKLTPRDLKLEYQSPSLRSTDLKSTSKGPKLTLRGQKSNSRNQWNSLRPGFIINYRIKYYISMEKGQGCFSAGYYITKTLNKYIMEEKTLDIIV